MSTGKRFDEYVSSGRVLRSPLPAPCQQTCVLPAAGRGNLHSTWRTCEGANRKDDGLVLAGLRTCCIICRSYNSSQPVKIAGFSGAVPLKILSHNFPWKDGKPDT